MKKKFVAIIPARSGSKGMKDKNIIELNGKPLVAYTIEAALKSNCFDTVMVSTDSLHYAKISELYGAEVPFLRSLENSGDTASTWCVVREVLDSYCKINRFYDVICVLQPTSPLRNAEDILQAVKLFQDKNADFLVSVCECTHSPGLANTIDDSLCIQNFIDREYFAGYRQNKGKYYRLNGAIYLLTQDHFINNIEYLYTEKSYAYIMPKERSIDIDGYLDFKLAELLLNE